MLLRYAIPVHERAGRTKIRRDCIPGRLYKSFLNGGTFLRCDQRIGVGNGSPRVVNNFKEFRFMERYHVINVVRISMTKPSRRVSAVYKDNKRFGFIDVAIYVENFTYLLIVA